MPGSSVSRQPPVALAALLLAAPLAADEVRFEINDAHVKDRRVPGVTILVAAEPGADALATAQSDAEGIARLDLAPGTYWVSYVRPGYVPIGDSETRIRPGGQVVTTTMTMLLEAEGGSARRRIRVVLNWGSEDSDVRDADAHAYCVCGATDAHVFFAAMRHEGSGHSVELDVDDRDWGGPETVTLNDPAPGSYRYWVHQYSRDADTLGESDVVVRVFFNDSLAGEFRIPPALDQRTWKPFHAITVGADLEPRLERFSAAELAAGADLEPPPDELSEEGLVANTSCAGGAALALAAIAVATLLVRRIVKRRS